MSSPANKTQPGATFLWVLGAFASFAVLFLVLQTLGGKKVESDPRAPERLANKEEITKAQKELIAKMGLEDASKKTVIYNKTLDLIKSRPTGPSAQVVPGSPTQLKQAAAAAVVPAAAPAPAAPAPAIAAPATN